VNYVKKKVEKVVKCPECDKKITIGVELETLKRQQILKSVYFPHIHIHGDPLHGLICYLNSELKVRNIGIIKSIEISRDSGTLSQFLGKWMNPFRIANNMGNKKKGFNYF
jgi:hypothetical protein